MPKRMSVVFDDEKLYTELKVVAARTGRHAKDIVADAVRVWLDTKEDEELRQDLDEARIEWENQGALKPKISSVGRSPALRARRCPTGRTGSRSQASCTY